MIKVNIVEGKRAFLAILRISFIMSEFFASISHQMVVLLSTCEKDYMLGLLNSLYRV
ncbi:hypothetical protein KIS4809_5029 [Bacillus sp. ZZV12-4809]|uniref:hypothetical protein n=1 Tax=Cytobacillus sp. FSL R5-0596 TaxID=2954696 RepID=UPI0013FCE418|nr:hypothetical protein KIS4809_5029 [Bacillus sp. ZZV12-4809]